MAQNGVPTDNLQEVPIVDELIGNRDKTTVRIPLSSLTALVRASTGPDYQTRAELFADLNWPDSVIATVWNDGTADFVGVYKKNGGSGTGSWSKIGGLPLSPSISAILASKADEVDLAATKTELEELEAEVKAGAEKAGLAIRPGEVPGGFSTSAVGAPGTLDRADKPAHNTVETITDLGRCLVVSNASATIAPKQANALQSGRIYRAYFYIKRLINPADAAGSTVEVGLQTMSADYQGIGKINVANKVLRVSDSLWRFDVRFGLDDNGLNDIVVSSGAVYVRPYIHCYGADHRTAIIQLETLDVTEIDNLEVDAAAVEANADRAELAAAASAVSAAASDDSKDQSIAAKVSSETARDASVAAAEVSGSAKIYGTKAEANAALPGLSDDQTIEVEVDESHGNLRTRYRVEGGAFAHKITFGQGYVLLSDSRYSIGFLNTAIFSTVYLSESQRQGQYNWDPEVPIEVHQGDDTEYNYIAPNAGAQGAWVRENTTGLPALVAPGNVRDLAGLVKGGSDVETVSELTDPTLAINKDRRVLLAGKPPSLAWCDGGTWWDLTNGGAIAPWWLPKDAALHVDFEHNRFYWAGAIRSISDLTAVAAGGYSLAYGFGFADTAWVDLEYTNQNDLADATGTFFSWTSGYPAGNRIEFVPAADLTYGQSAQVYVNPGFPASTYQSFRVQTKIEEGGARWSRDTRRRFLTRIKSTAPVRYQPDNGDVRDGSTLNVGALAVPTLLGFANRAWAPGDPTAQLSGATLHRVTLWSSDLSAPHIKAVGQRSATNTKPVHLIGDSFLNLYGVASFLEKEFKVNSKIVPFSQDSVGGSTLSQQAARYAAYAGTEREKWWDSTLVICDFGFEEPQKGIDAIKSMLRYIRHDRWVYMQPALSSAITPVTNLPTPHAIMKAWCGDHFVSTLQEAWDAGNGSPEDLAQIAIGKWPVSLTISQEDFHPNEANGHPFIANLIYSALEARGYV